MTRSDLEPIIGWVPSGASVLDLACGDGELLARLKTERAVSGLGLEINVPNIIAAVTKNLNIVHQDIEDGLTNFEPGSFDCVILVQALQVLKEPDRVLKRMVSIGQEAIITFPNFAFWRYRVELTFRGRMPRSKAIPFEWFNTPNIHFCTITDFERLCDSLNIDILERHLSNTSIGKIIRGCWPNGLVETVSYRIKMR